MSDIASEMTKSYRSALNAVCEVYNGQAPTNAVSPYAVMSVTYEELPVRSIRMFNVTVSLDMYAEFPEGGGPVSLDAMADSIVGIIVPTLPADRIAVDGFHHVNSKVLSISNGKADVDPLRVFQKSLRFNHLVTQTN